MKEIKVRKKELQDEINRIEEKYGNKASRVQSGIERTMQPIRKIRENPIASVGISIAIGFLIGQAGRKKSKTKKTDYSGKRGFSSLFMNELKYMAVHKMMLYFSDMLDKKILSRNSTPPRHEERKHHEKHDA